MIEFDPVAMLAPLEASATSVKASTGAPAVLVEVSRGGRTASTATGVENVNTGHRATTDQTFEIGSQSKMMTAVAVLQLADEGLIDLDARISSYIPGKTAGIVNASTATVRDLLEMRSGIPAYNEATDAAGTPLFKKAGEAGQWYGPDQALATARGMAASESPGTFHYGNTNYLLLGLLIEDVTGDSWADVLKERIFDRAGMTSTSGDQFAADPKRLSSYDKDGGRLVDVTHATWQARGESGVVSTTHDLIAFERALLVDKTLLSDWAFGEMTDFVKLYPGIYFGLGLFEHTVSGGILEGFAGGTLGTSTVTYTNPFDGTSVAMAANLVNVDSDTNAFQLYQAMRTLDAWAPVVDDGSPLAIASVSAAALDVGVNDHGGVHFACGGASLDLTRGLRQLDAAETTFADGSVLVVGDGTSGTSDDDLGNTISIRKDFAAALNCDNRLIGLGGDDRLAGGNGNDAISGGSGRDKVWGAAGDDRISGGTLGDHIVGGQGDDYIWAGGGWDLLYGRKGADVLTGGNGHDTFLFNDNDSTATAPDTIRDFDLAQDTLDLHLVDAVRGGRDSDFRWIGDAGFSGAAGELHYVERRRRHPRRGRHQRRRRSGSCDRAQGPARHRRGSHPALNRPRVRLNRYVETVDPPQIIK